MVTVTKTEDFLTKDDKGITVVFPTREGGTRRVGREVRVFRG